MISAADVGPPPTFHFLVFPAFPNVPGIAQKQNELRLPAPT
jgi:hypothetical protein